MAHDPFAGFTAEALVNAAKNIHEVRDNVIAVKGEEYEKRISFFIAIGALSDMIDPEKYDFAAHVVNSLIDEYVRVAKVSLEEQKEMHNTIELCRKFVSDARAASKDAQ